MLTIALMMFVSGAPEDGGASTPVERLFDEASELKKAKKYELAVERLERCITLQQKHHPCYRLLGSVWTSIATRDKSEQAMEKARKYYERFLEVAPEDDPFRPRSGKPVLGDWWSDEPIAPKPIP